MIQSFRMIFTVFQYKLKKDYLLGSVCLCLSVGKYGKEGGEEDNWLPLKNTRVLSGHFPKCLENIVYIFVFFMLVQFH